ncbi:MAG: PQQ-binding-like beta-propeller repeat protein [Theionarchaea archaeon]|nr:PQQ-binding-like beta-propeller repeat protein [Theionarchaea archaeon]
MTSPLQKSISLLLMVAVVAGIMTVQWHIPPDFDAPEIYSPVQSITTIDITYTAVTAFNGSRNTDPNSETADSILAYHFYRIQRINSEYFASTGEHVTPELIGEVAESFTDLYQVSYQTTYRGYTRLDYSPHFTIEITLSNGKTIQAESESSYYCFIPWNITYEGSNYVQYSGKIPSALFKILIKLDNQWESYQKIATWGCYPAHVPPAAQEKGISLDFPSTTDICPPEEVLGQTHLLLSLALPEVPMCSPVYHNQKIFLPYADKIVCIDAQSRTQLYTIPFEIVQHSYPSSLEQKIAVSDDTLYVGAPDSHIYSIDTETGSIRWTYKIPSVTDYIAVSLIDNTVIALTGGIVCLEREHGNVLWEVSNDTWNEAIYDDAVLFAELDQQSAPHYVILDIGTGEPLWSGPLPSIQHPTYSEGVFYFFDEEGTLTSITLETMTETDLFWPQYPVDSINILGDNIALMMHTDSEYQSVVMLHINGLKKWEYNSENTPISRTILTEKKVFLVREGGVIQALDAETGAELWVHEVRGTEITSFYQYNENIYVLANDGYIHCLSAETGILQWYIVAQRELDIFPDEVSLAATHSEEYLLVLDSSGTLHLFSL